MPGRYSDYDFEVDFEDEHNGVFDSLLDSFDECPECGAQGPFELKRNGYVCTEDGCDTVVIPNR